MDSVDLLKHIADSQSAHISFLQSLAQSPSPNPPGSTIAAASVIRDYLTQHSIPFETISPNPSLPNICSSFQGEVGPGPRLILNGHIDHFPPSNPSEWLRDPYSGELVNNRIHGCGTVDMKAGTAASIIAYTYLYRFRESLRGSVGLCAVGDEETGGKWGSRFLVGQGGEWRGDCMIDAEPGGLGTIRFAEKGTLRLTFTTRTEGAHGAYTHRSKSATRIAAKLIVELGAVEEIVPKIDPELAEYMKREDVKEAIDQAMGKGAKDIMLNATLNIGVIHGGVKVNVIPDKCVFEADIRLPIGLGRKEVLGCIERILENYPEVEMEVQEAASNPSNLCSPSHPMVGILERNGQRVTGKKPVAIPSLGATDCKFWRYENVPAYVFGVSPEGMAMRDESVDVDEFLSVVKTHALAAWEFLGGEM